MQPCFCNNPPKEKILLCRRHKFNRFILIGALLVITPAFFSLLLALHLINAHEQNYIADRYKQLEKRANNFLTDIDAETFFRPIFQELSSAVLALPVLDHKNLAPLCQKAFSKAGQDFKVVVFDHSNNIVFDNFADPEVSSIFHYVWKYARSKERDDYSTSYKGPIAKVLGRDFHPRFVRNNETGCYPILNHQQRSLLYHHKNNKNDAGIMMHIDLSDDRQTLVNSLVKQKNTTENPILQQSRHLQTVSQNFSVQKIQELFKISLTNQNKPFAHENYHWQYLAVWQVPLLFGQKDLSPPFMAAKTISVTFFAILTVLSLYYLYRNMVSGKARRVSIRYKLVIIFLFAVYLPVLGLFLLGYRGLENRRTVLENNAIKGTQDLLFKIDSEFTRKEAEILAVFTRLFADNTWQSQISDDWEKAEQVIRSAAKVPLSGENFFNHMDIRDLNQNQLYSTSQGVANDRTKEINRIISLICLEKYIPEQLPKNYITKQSDLILKNMMENPVIGFTSFYEQPGKLIPMEFEGSSFYWYWNYYSKNNDKVAYIYGNTRLTYNVINYLHDALRKRMNIGNNALPIIARYPATKLWIPENAGNEVDLVRLNKLAETNSAVETTRITYAGEIYLATCLPGLKLKKAFLTGLYPEAEINRQIGSLQQQIYLGVLLIFIISILTGLLLSKTFLQPIGELNLGLKALRLRHIDFRVQIENQDELGELGKTFNQMMEEVKEMFLASAVQQCLIPTTAPDMPGYDSVIYNKMATDVGGDYADFFSLPDQRYLIVLGDVTGHGVSSSILTAMVKALVFRFASKDTKLEVILKSLSEMIFELLKYRKLMTFCAMILDTKDNTFLLANAGHPFPIVCDVNGKITKIEHASLPLGVSAKRSNYTTTAGTFAPGDVLLLYTDGIAEGANPAGEIFGFDTVEQILTENRHKSSNDIKNSLLEQFWQHYQREELDDDLTFILLRRLHDESTTTDVSTLL